MRRFLAGLIFTVCCSGAVAQDSPFVTVYRASAQPEVSGVSADGRIVVTLNTTGDHKTFISTGPSGETDFPVPLGATQSRLAPTGTGLAWLQSSASEGEDWWNQDDAAVYHHDYETFLTQPIFTGFDQRWNASRPQFSDDGDVVFFRYTSSPELSGPAWDSVVIHRLSDGSTTRIPLLSDDPIQQISTAQLAANGTRALIQRSAKVQFIDPKELFVLDLNTLQRTGVCNENEQCSGASISRDGRRVVYRKQQAVYLFDVMSGHHSRLPGITGGVRIHAVSTDGSMMIYSGAGAYTDGYENVPDAGAATDVNDLVPGSRGLQLRLREIDSGREKVVSAINNYRVLSGFPELADWSADDTTVFFVHAVDLSYFGLSPVWQVLARQVDFEFVADPAVAGLWHDLGQPYQGINLHVSSNGTAVISWLRLDHNGQPQWVTGQGSLDNNSLAVEAFTVVGSHVGPASTRSQATLSPWGTLAMEFHSCTRATFKWSGLDGPEAFGSMELTRLSYTAGVGCL